MVQDQTTGFQWAEVQRRYFGLERSKALFLLASNYLNTSRGKYTISRAMTIVTQNTPEQRSQRPEWRSSTHREYVDRFGWNERCVVSIGQQQLKPRRPIELDRRINERRLSNGRGSGMWKYVICLHFGRGLTRLLDDWSLLHWGWLSQPPHKDVLLSHQNR